jgi:hypothetical protein
VCKKGDCWLTKYTKEERDEARKEFKRCVHQYLTDNDIDDNFNKDIIAMALNTSTLTTISGNFFYDDYGVEHFMTSNGPIQIEIAKNIVTSINNNAFVHGLTGSTEPGSTEPGGMEPGTARRGDKVNTENLTVDIDFLDCHFDNNG